METHKDMIPLFDLREYDADKRGFAQKLGDAFSVFGFVRIVGHGIPEDLLKKADTVNAAFWDLPNDVKDRYSQPPYQLGYVAYGRDAEKALSSTAPDRKENWDVRSRWVGTQYAETTAPLLAVPEVPEFGQTHLTLFGAFEALTRRVMQPLSLYMGQPENWFDDKFDRNDSMMRSIHYPQGGNAAGHLDLNMLTWLRAEKPGLFISDKFKRVHEVTAAPGELLLNGGMQLGLLTNNNLEPMGHWVKANYPRDTVVFFVHPNPDVVLAPLPKFAGQPPAKDPSYFPQRDAKGQYGIRVHDFNMQQIGKIYGFKP